MALLNSENRKEVNLHGLPQELNSYRQISISLILADMEFYSILIGSEFTASTVRRISQIVKSEVRKIHVSRPTYNKNPPER